MRKNPPSFRPPGRRRTTSYPWGGFREGAAGVVTRTWTAEGQRVLHLTFDENFPLLRHSEVAATQPPDSPYYDGPGRLDLSNFAYHLANTFRPLRRSVFDVYVQVSATYTDIDGVEYKATARIRTRAEFPLWVKATDAMRNQFYAKDRRPGSKRIEWDERGRRRFTTTRGRSRRQAPAVDSEYSSPPDLFWLSAYAIWYAMEKCTADLQDRGRSYLERLTFIQYTIDYLTVVQFCVEEGEEDEGYDPEWS
jgi:hypothetical protein